MAGKTGTGRAAAAGVVFAATIGSFFSVTPTIVAVMGVFLKTIAADFGWPRSEVAGALTAVALGTALAAPFAGRMIDRVGARRTALIGALLLGLCILVISRVPASPIPFYLAFLLAGIAGALPNSLAFSRLLSGWFGRTRGLWIGFCGGVGVGGGSFAFPMIAAILLGGGGWRSGFVAIAGLVLLIGLPVLALLLREPPLGQAGAADPESAEAGVSYREAMRSGFFWWLVSILPLGAGCMTAMFTTIVPIVTDRGVAIDGAVLVVQAFAFTTIIVEPAAGWLADRASSPKLIAPLFLTAAAGMLLLLHARDETTFLASGVLMGVGAGVEYSMLLYFLSRYFGLREFGAIAGIFFAVTLGFGAVAPLGLNLVFDLTGSYRPGIYAIIVILLYSSAAMLTFPRYRFASSH